MVTRLIMRLALLRINWNISSSRIGDYSSASPSVAYCAVGLYNDCHEMDRLRIGVGVVVFLDY